MKIFKAKIRIGNLSLEVESKEKWDLLMQTYGHLTVDEAMEQIYNNYHEVA